MSSSTLNAFAKAAEVARNGPRRIGEIVRGLKAVRVRAGLWKVHEEIDGKKEERGRFTGGMPWFSNGEGPVSMILYDDDAAECGFIPEGILVAFDERPGRAKVTKINVRQHARRV